MFLKGTLSRRSLLCRRRSLIPGRSRWLYGSLGGWLLLGLGFDLGLPPLDFVRSQPFLLSTGSTHGNCYTPASSRTAFAGFHDRLARSAGGQTRERNARYHEHDCGAGSHLRKK